MTPRARTPGLNPCDVPSLSLDDLVQLFIVTPLDQVVQNRQHSSSAAIEGQVREREVTLPAGAVRDRSSLVTSAAAKESSP